GDSRCGHFWSHGRVAAVNGEISACDEGSMAGAQERNRLGHFLRLADASQQMERSADSVGLLLVAVGHFIHQTAPSPARRNRIDANLVRSQIHGFIARELQYRRFGHGIEPAPRLRHLGADAAEVDHGAATALHHVWFHRLQHHDAAHDINVVAVQPVFARRIESVVHITHARLIRISMPPNFATASFTQAAIWASSARSVFTNCTSLPSALATACPSLSLISTITTFVPSRLNARTTAAPIMVAPPVTMATFPFSPSMLVSR